jgi:hypothetical protein
MKNPFEWEFLNEPIWRWFIFLVVLSIFIAVWNGVLRFIE